MARFVVSILAALLLLAGCGGGGSSSTQPAMAPAAPAGGGGGGDPAPTGTPTASSGPITGFGSIFVAGVEYETDEADIAIDGAAASQAGLSLGMRVSVRGTVNADGRTGNAEVVIYEAELVGPVTSDPIIEDDGNIVRFNIFDVQVVAERDITTFESDLVTYDFDTLARTDVLEVSGTFSAATRTLEATRIERLDARQFGQTQVMLRGAVSDLSGDRLQFTLGIVTVTIDDGTDSSALTTPLTDGDNVRVRGVLTADSAVTALRIRPVRNPLLEIDDDGDSDNAEIEGTIDAIDADGNLTIDGLQVDVSGATIVPSGATLAVGTSVEAEGQLVDGVLVAGEIHVRAVAVRLVGRVTAIDADAMSINLGFADGGDAITVRVDTSTDIRQQGPSPDIGFADLMVTDVLRISAIQTDDGLLARHIRRQTRQVLELRGRVEAFETDAGTITVNGVTFGTDGDTEFEVDGDEDQSVSMADFFAMLEVGAPIKIKDASFDGIADEAEIGDDDDDEGNMTVNVRGEFSGLTATGVTVAGITFSIDDGTGFFTRGNRPVADFDTFAALVEPNDILKAKDTNGDGTLERLRLERRVPGVGGGDDDDDGDDDDGTEVEVEGEITALDADAGAVEIEGASFATDENTEFVIREENDVVVSAEEFFANVMVGEFGEARDRSGDGTADRIRVDRDEDGEDGDGDGTDSDDDGLRIRGVLEAVDVDAGTITVLGLTLAVASDARFELDSRGDDEIDIDRSEFFASAMAGDRVRAEDRNGDGQLDRLRLIPADDGSS